MGLQGGELDWRNQSVVRGRERPDMSERRAEKEGTFPVRFWYGEGSLTPAQQRKAKRDHKAAMKLMYPWRTYA
jgi:hypothetical protein